jgi:uncharacterized protein (DUF1697 family)
MPRFVAFLRAINVGGHTVKMDRLRALFEALEFSSVETFIASGNVIFETPAAMADILERQIERHLQAALGYAVATFIRSTAELAEIVHYRPFKPAELDEAGHLLYIGFLPDSPTDKAQQKLMALCNDINDFHIHGREIYWLCRKTMSESNFSGALLEKTLGMPATLRNVTTVKKLAAKYPADQ